MKFTVELEIDDLEEDELFDEKFQKSLKEAVIYECVKNLQFEDSKYFNGLKENIVDEAKKYIHERVDIALKDVVAMIARKKAMYEMTPEALNLSEEIDKAIARKFGTK